MKNVIAHLVISLTLAGATNAAPQLGAYEPGIPANSFGAQGTGTGAGTGSGKGQRSAEDARYQQGTEALNAGDWKQAIEAYDAVARGRGARADAAMYWKAYAQHKAGQAGEALTTIGELRKAHPQSRWLREARALEIEIRGLAGQPVQPENVADEDLKLMAIQGLMNRDDEEAVPILEKFLQGNHSAKLKERALFVLAQSDSPRAQQVLKQVAMGQQQAGLQKKAVHYLGIHGGERNQQTLLEVYQGSNEVEVKKAVLHSFGISGNTGRLLTVAKGEQNEDLRAAAIHGLGIAGGKAELGELYASVNSVEAKGRILHAMGVAGANDQLAHAAKGETNPEVRRKAIQALGVFGGKSASKTLVEMYGQEKQPEIKKSLIHALFVNDSAAALVALAKQEQDPQMRKEIVHKLDRKSTRLNSSHSQ